MLDLRMRSKELGVEGLGAGSAALGYWIKQSYRIVHIVIVDNEC